MPIGIYQRTKDGKENMRLARLKVIASGKTIGMTGKHHPEETKRKISEYVKNHPLAYWTGRKRPKETIDKLRKVFVERISNPEKHPRWKGGISKNRGSYCSPAKGW